MKKKMLPIYLSESDHEALKALCKDKDTPMTRMVELMIKAKLKRLGK